MKLHRFYVGNKVDLTSKIWVDDERLFHQWTRVLRFRPDQKVALFNSQKEEKLYSIDRIEPSAVHLSLVTDIVANEPNREVYLCFSLLKKDKNNWVLQKATELGVRHFVPLVTDRTEKTGFDVERAEKIVVEASEQCGRVDIPRVREPVNLETAIRELQGSCKLYVAEQGDQVNQFREVDSLQSMAIFIGPEGGWTDKEKDIFRHNKVEHLPLGKFTLRAETACVVAAGYLQN